MLKKIVFICGFTFTLAAVFAQKSAIIRGNVYDKNGGQPVPFANVILRGSTQGATTDLNGFYQISNVKAGDYTLFVSFIGYDSLEQKVKYTLGKSERLKSRKAIDLLFAEGKSFSAFPFKVIYKLKKDGEGLKTLNLAAAFSASKKNFKKSVDKIR